MGNLGTFPPKRRKDQDQNLEQPKLVSSLENHTINILIAYIAYIVIFFPTLFRNHKKPYLPLALAYTF